MQRYKINHNQLFFYKTQLHLISTQGTLVVLPRPWPSRSRALLTLRQPLDLAPAASGAEADAGRRAGHGTVAGVEVARAWVLRSRSWEVSKPDMTSILIGSWTIFCGGHSGSRLRLIGTPLANGRHIVLLPGGVS